MKNGTDVVPQVDSLGLVPESDCPVRLSFSCPTISVKPDKFTSFRYDDGTDVV